MSRGELAELTEIMCARPLLTRKDLARRYGVALRSVDRWHRAGKLPRAIFLPGCRLPLWRPVDIQKFEKAGRICPR